MSSINDELEAIEWSARGGKRTDPTPRTNPAPMAASGAGRGGGGMPAGPRKKGSLTFLPPGYRAGGGHSYGGAGSTGATAGGNDAASGDELLVDFPGSDDEQMDESDDDRYSGAPPPMKPGGGYGAQNISTNAPPSFKVGAAPAPIGSGGPPRRGSGVMMPSQMAGVTGTGSGNYADDSDDSSEDYRGGGYGSGANPGYGAGGQPGYGSGGGAGGQPGYGAGGPPGYSAPGLPGNPMPANQAQPRLGEAERMRLRQIQMQREASTKSGTEDHRPLVGGFAAAAYEAARADHFQQSKTPAREGPRPRDLPSI